MVCSINITMPTKLIKKTCRNRFLKHFLFSWNFRPPPLSARHNSRMRRNFENILLAGSCHKIHLLHWYYMHHTRSSQSSVLGIRKIGVYGPNRQWSFVNRCLQQSRFSGVPCTLASNLGYLAPPQDIFLWVPNCSLGPSGCETKVS